MARPIAIVANPAAGRGRAADITAKVVEAAGPDCPLFVTRHSGDEGRCVAAALQSGAGAIIAVGGDGTWSKVAGALLAQQSDCRLAVIAAGTGNDFAKSAGAPSTDIERTVRLARDDVHITVDVLRIADDYCINVAGFGFDAHVLASIRPVPLLSGDALYIYSALRELFFFKGLEIDAGNGFRNHLILAVCNGARFGGQFHIAPRARLDDGLATIVAIHDASPLARLGLFASVIGGSHTSRGDVTEITVRSATLKFRAPPIYEIDGELRQARESEIALRVIPGALRVITSSLSGSASRPLPAAP